MAIIRYTRYLLAVLAIVTLVAAAPSPTKTIGLFDQPPHTSPTCVIGVPAVQPSDGSFPITYYAIVAPTAAAGDAIAAHYKLNSTWSKAHRLDGNHFNSSGVGPYEAMKCQYNCNARDNCVSFFVSDIDGPCALFDALIEPTLFVLDEDSNPHGAYDLLCNPPPNPFNGGKRDGVVYQPVRREEKVIGTFATNTVLDDNCTETHVSPSEDWVNYAPNQDFVTKHGHYTFTNIESGDGAGFETTHQACHKTCTGFTFCKSVFISFVASQWSCTIFDVDLTQDLYVQGPDGGVNTWPYGFNQKCPV